jgi:hypothetical protein
VAPPAARILASVAPGGVLLYETFAQGNETVGKPSRPDFLLRTGELAGNLPGTAGGGVRGRLPESPPRFVQRIAAVREAPATGPNRRVTAL